MRSSCRADAEALAPRAYAAHAALASMVDFVRSSHVRPQHRRKALRPWVPLGSLVSRRVLLGRGRARFCDRKAATGHRAWSREREVTRRTASSSCRACRRVSPAIRSIALRMVLVTRTAFLNARAGRALDHISSTLSPSRLVGLRFKRSRGLLPVDGALYEIPNPAAGASCAHNP
jgi:hypothetical protein